MKRLLSITMAITLLLLCCACTRYDTVGTAAETAPKIETFEDLCALIGQDYKKAPFYKTNDKNIVIEEEQNGNDYWFGYTFKSKDSKYCFAGFSSPPVAMECEAENGKIVSFDLWLTQEDYENIWWAFMPNNKLSKENCQFVHSLSNGTFYGLLTYQGVQYEIELYQSALDSTATDKSQYYIGISPYNGVY